MQVIPKPKILIKSLTIAITGVLICITPAMSRTLTFRGRLDNGREVIGMLDNNHGDTCIKNGNILLLGTVENDRGIPNSDPMRFHSEKIIRRNKTGKKISNYKVLLRVKIIDDSFKTGVLTKSETKSIEDCDYMFSDKFYNRNRDK